MSARRKTTNAADATMREACREMRDADMCNRMVRDGAELIDEIKYAADRFNAMRGDFASFVEVAKNWGASAPKWAETVKSLSHGDYGNLLSRDTANMRKGFGGVDIKGVSCNVEECGGFATAVELVMQMQTPQTRMLACIEINAAIAEAIDGWKSKIAKMESRRGDGGNAKAEIAMVEKSLVKFAKVIEILQKRGQQISEIYADAMKQLERFRDKCTREFRYIWAK